MAMDDETVCALAGSNLSRRALNALKRAGILTLDDAAEWSDRDLLSLPHIGPVSVASLRVLVGGPSRTDNRLRPSSRRAASDASRGHASPP